VMALPSPKILADCRVIRADENGVNVRVLAAAAAGEGDLKRVVRVARRVVCGSRLSSTVFV
jgi:hypothetical protein